VLCENYVPHHRSWLPVASERLGAPNGGFDASDIRPVIALRCHALLIRHSVSYLPATSGNAALATLRPLRGNPARRVPAANFSCGATIACAPANGRRSALSRNGHRHGQGAWHGQRCCLVIESTVRASSQHRRAACDDAARMHTVGLQGFECRQKDWVMFSRPRNVNRLGWELHLPSAGQSR
jgi:hypothetical protein